MEKTIIRVLVMDKKWSSSTFPGYWKRVTSKAGNRAAVHGVKPPAPDILHKEELEKEIQKAKAEKEAKRKQVENTVESHVNNSKPDSSSL
ncbi:hypothetical protein Fmac_007264 [Flemingia macrophylla]|uniref:Uncharacterized protein n=1 Tax=Flemingia macrophylla TaxID=520843 RepID=A0ABD1NCZ9_9FABA